MYSIYDSDILITTPANLFTEFALSGDKLVDYDSLGRIRFLKPGKYILNYILQFTLPSGDVSFFRANDDDVSVGVITDAGISYGKNMGYCALVTTTRPNSFFSLTVQNATGTQEFLCSLDISVVRPW